MHRFDTVFAAESSCDFGRSSSADGLPRFNGALRLHPLAVLRNVTAAVQKASVCTPLRGFANRLGVNPVASSNCHPKKSAKQMPLASIIKVLKILLLRNQMNFLCSMTVQKISIFHLLRSLIWHLSSIT